MVTHSFTDGHAEYCLPSEALGYSPGDGDVGHRDHLNRNTLLPLLAQDRGVLPIEGEGGQGLVNFNLLGKCMFLCILNLYIYDT